MPLPTPRTPIRSISYFGWRFLISPLELFCAGAASTGAVSASCVVASGDCCACELPLQTALARNAVQLHLAMRARQEKLNSGWFVPEQQTERFAILTRRGEESTLLMCNCTAKIFAYGCPN